MLQATVISEFVAILVALFNGVNDNASEQMNVVCASAAFFIAFLDMLLISLDVGPCYIAALLQ